MEDVKNKYRSVDAEDNVNNNARYSESGEITREDNRDKKNSIDDWDAEHNRTGRHK